MKSSRLTSIPFFALFTLIAACGGQPDTANTSQQAAEPARTVSPPGAAVFIITPADGATVSSPVQVKFGISGAVVAPAGDMRANTGHHHLLVDAELESMDQSVPSSEQFLHFGKGQTETMLELEPGRHTLQLVLGDGAHVPHDPPVMSDRIEITVE